MGQDDEEDIFVCGKCREQFVSLNSFMVHKQEKCSGKSSDDVSKPITLQSTTDQNVQTEDISSIISDARDESCHFKTEIFDNELLTLSDSSVVVSNGELLNLAINETQVFTVNEIYELSSGDQNKQMMSQLLQHELILTPDVDKDKDKLTIESLDELPADSKVCTENHQLFHESMTKQSKNLTAKAKVKQKCRYCKKEFAKNFDLQQHIRSHTGEKPFQCIVCGRAFAQKSNVKKHMESHKVWPNDSITNTLPKEPIKKLADGSVEQTTKDDIIVDDSYVCSFCNISLPAYIQFRSHMKMHNDQKVYKCIQTGCNETFIELDPFIDHIRNHDTDIQYRCHTCSKVFNSLQSFGCHQLQHSMYPHSKKNAGPSYFRCTKCMNKYASAEALAYHLDMSSHNYPCKHCDKIFYSERLLRRHLTMHGSVQLIRCPTCSKNFRSVYSLKLHLLTHTGEKPFECHLCKSSFNRKDKLKRHMLVHDSKKLKCPFHLTLGCNREFRRRDKLRLHFLSHAKPSNKKGRNLNPSQITIETPSTTETNKTHCKTKGSTSNIGEQDSGNDGFEVMPVQIMACEDFDLSFAGQSDVKKFEIVHIPLPFSESLIPGQEGLAEVDDGSDNYLKNTDSLCNQDDIDLFVTQTESKSEQYENQNTFPFENA